MPIMVTVKRDEPFEKALRRFKKNTKKPAFSKTSKKALFI